MHKDWKLQFGRTNQSHLESSRINNEAKATFSDSLMWPSFNNKKKLTPLSFGINQSPGT